MIISDARVPVVCGLIDLAQPDDAVLWEGEARPWAGGSAHFTADARHVPGCTCCVGRTEAGRALAALLQARARGQVPFFARVLVVATAQGCAAVEAAVKTDPVASACFKMG